MKLHICFTKSKKHFRPFSEAIIFRDKVSLGPGPEISHCAGKFVSATWDRDLFYQASGRATNFMGQTLFLNNNEIVEEYVLDVPKEVVIKFGQICIDREGKPYAFRQTIGLALMFLFMLDQNPFADGDVATNCIEEWAKILSEHYEVPHNMDNMSVRPFRDFIATIGTKL